nr:MAG TPA: hypothetical protein [Caudoviricetes sp.]
MDNLLATSTPSYLSLLNKQSWCWKHTVNGVGKFW